METKNHSQDPYNKLCKFERCKKFFIARRLNQDFCSSLHHSQHNNSIARVRRNLVKTVNAVLLRNRNILEKLLQAGTEKISSEELMRLGYKPNYFTHWQIETESNQYIFICYDLGILKTDDKNYKIVKP
ncbi:MAG TPA: hypothetical protein VFJ43_15455 [Bacteroidia bacterium]|nr:hypothetical protein [Bacteroidia bacterium]